MRGMAVAAGPSTHLAANHEAQILKFFERGGSMLRELGAFGQVLEDASKVLRHELLKVDDDFRFGRCRDFGDGCRHGKRGEEFLLLHEVVDEM
jgi:hypothetical protein